MEKKFVNKSFKMSQKEYKCWDKNFFEIIKSERILMLYLVFEKYINNIFIKRLKNKLIKDKLE